jgi:glycosyltransferase involved in cell wall biosynthesis
MDRSRATLAMIPALRTSVIISNHARNHSYPIAEAAAEAGYLRKFVTGVYYKPETRGGQLFHSLASRVGQRDRKRLEGRRSDRIPDEQVVSVWVPEVLEQLAARALSRFGGDPRPATYLKCEAFDLAVARRHFERCAIFHGFEQCALFSLRRARQLGAITVLDQPIIHRTELDRIEREERARMGVPMPTSRPFWFDKHVARKYAEHALTDYAFVGLDFPKRTLVKNGFAPDRVFVIPYGTDVTSYRPIVRPPRPGFNVLYVGPLHYWKGLHYLLDVVPKLDVPGARLTIVGRADPDWAPYFLPRIAALGERVRHIPGLPKAEIEQVYAEADVLVFPSLVGGIGLVCYEAMATGLPVITSDGDVVIRDGVDGLSIPLADLDGWRRALTDLARDRQRRLALGAAGAERVKAFSWDAYRRGIIAAYETIWERERGGRAGAGSAS